MYIDAITLAAVADEWRKLLIGARIDTIIQPTEYALALQCYAPGAAQFTDTANGQGASSGGASSGGGGQNRWLYLSAHPQLARAHITALKPQKIASEPPPFVMLLRKYLEGARVESIKQPRWERVLEIVAGYRKSPDSEERIRFRLILEIMGRLSNIIFCDEEGIILGSLKRVGSDVNRYREIITGIPYIPPPPQQRMLIGQTLPRLEPTKVTAAQLSICLPDMLTPLSEESTAKPKKTRKGEVEQPRIWQLLTRNLLGWSPLIAREAVYRTTEDAETLLTSAHEAMWEELAWNVRDLAEFYDTHNWQPQMIERSPQSGERAQISSPELLLPVAFAPYILLQYPQADRRKEENSDLLLMPPHWNDSNRTTSKMSSDFASGMRVRQSPSINVLLDDYFARTEWRDAVESLRSPLRKILQTQRDRCKRKAELLQREMATSEEAAQYRLYGDLLLAHQHEIAQGQKNVTLQNYFAEAMLENDQTEGVTVPLDPRFDAVGNANRYFNKYHKLRRALELVPDQIEQNNAELATIEQLLTDLLLAENAAEVAHVKDEVQAAGYIRGKAAFDKKAQKAAKKAKGKSNKQGKGKPVPPGGGVPLHIQSREGFTLLIGKNSRQNEDVTFHQASANDIWLHARGVAGAHVIIKAAGRQVPQSAIEQAASLAAYYSGARGTTSTPVDYTLQRHVRHMKNGGPGMVIYEREHTLHIEPDKALELLKR
jgi:predicted ribosome quality control (RQC) complex YloA/Tae2 family protein